MSEIGPVKVAPGSETRCNHIRESMLLTWLLYGVVRATQALAGDQPPNADSAGRPVTASLFLSPLFSAKPLADVEVFSATEFRPRKHSLVEGGTASSPGSIIDWPMPQSPSIWQQMTDYRSQERVRLLTLWQTRRSSLSLQAGKHGAPSLQWTAPWMNREGASRGLFDHLFAVSPSTAGGNARSTVPRPTGASIPPKPLDSGSAASAK
jgi:hypothetical protein